MSEIDVALLSVGMIVLFQVITTAFLYGRLTEKVRTALDRTTSHGHRLENLENVQNGPGGHGERLTALESWRLEHLRRERHE